ncbi:MAG: HTH domain-containing protein [Marinifilaceae bacterium]
MDFSHFLQKTDRIKDLAQRRCTGTPKELAQRLEVSERTLLRLIKALRDSGSPITYSRTTQSYIID